MSYEKGYVTPALAATDDKQAIVKIESADVWDTTKAALVFTPDDAGGPGRIATDKTLLAIKDLFSQLATQETLAVVVAMLEALNDQGPLFAGLPTAPVLHRTAVTAADTVNPTNPTTPGSAVGFSGNPGVGNPGTSQAPTGRQYVDFDVTLTVSSGAGTALVQLMLWDPTVNAGSGAWYGGAYEYLTTTAIPTTIPTTRQALTAPCVLRFETRGRICFLKVLAIAGASASLSCNAASV